LRDGEGTRGNGNVDKRADAGRGGMIHGEVSDFRTVCHDAAPRRGDWIECTVGGACAHRVDVYVPAFKTVIRICSALGGKARLQVSTHGVEIDEKLTGVGGAGRKRQGGEQQGDGREDASDERHGISPGLSAKIVVAAGGQNGTRRGKSEG